MAPQRTMARTGSLPSMSELDESMPHGEAAEDSEDTVQVYVRVRPFSKREQNQAGEAPIALVEQDQRSIVVQAAPPRRFRFDGVQGEEASQQEMFELVGRSIADGFLEGYNGTVCVYGQTGAGKTYTMVGPVTSVQQMQSDPRRGLICRTLDYVFTEILKRRAGSHDVLYTCRCSFLEIYREQITDLLDASNTVLQLREDQSRGVYVERLSEPVVSSREEAFEVLLQGLQQRRTGATQMNERSSRSHAIFTITIEMGQVRSGLNSRQIVRLNLVDLAGSERQMGVADLLRSNTLPGQGVPVKEASAINRSLSALTNVIMSLSHEEKLRRKSSGSSRGWTCRRNYVNYRDSKLTFILRDSLGGSSKTAIVANISPSALCSSETLSTLKFAARAKHIQCSAVRREEFSASVEDLVREVTTLRRRVSELESGQESHAVSTGSTCSRSSCRSSCSTEEDSLAAGASRATQEVELQARLSETKRDLFKAISQLAQVEAKLQLATAEANDLTQEAAKLQAARSLPVNLQTCRKLQGVSSLPGPLPVRMEAYRAGVHTDVTPKACSTQPHTPMSTSATPMSTSASVGNFNLEPASPQQGSSPRVIWQSRSSPRPVPQPLQPVQMHPRPQLSAARPHSPPHSSRVSTPKGTQWPQANMMNAFGMPTARSQVSSPMHLAARARDATFMPQAAS
mmetsp:Transcript_59567/g.174255  ORF Transcript_59567/g.174255 Transcript_59567/m.174255 type:complete len:684 (+) Transcript_59567:77-2128(+)